MALRQLFIERGPLIRNSGAAPEASTLGEFIAAREHLLASGALTAFHEQVLAATTAHWGNVAQRLSSYEKSGTLNNAPFCARVVIMT